MKVLGALLLVVSSLLPAATASAQSGAGGTYALKTDSRFETGCFGPCLCPVVPQGMQGSFRLRLRDLGPLYTTYDVLNVDWALPASDPPTSIVGTGTYRIGGEVAVQQQMTLDLSVGGGPAQHFDSGLVLGGGAFPDINVRLSLHQEQTCTDTVLVVVATPLNASSVGDTGAPLVSGIRAVTPNPFRGEAQLALTLARPEPATVDILDLQGRVVRHLMPRRWVATGITPVTWNGRDDAGRECATGLYFIRAGIGARTFSARVVRIR